MHSQLSYTATKLEIIDRQRRAERELSRGRPAKPSRRLGALARIVSPRRPAPATALAPAGHDAA
jgi:hypothetical protein